MEKRNIGIIILIFAFGLFSSGIFAQTQNEDKKITIESVITDSSGQPVPGAVIYGGEEAIRTRSDASGSFSITVPERTTLRIEAEGYVSGFFIPTAGSFTLQSAELMYGDKDDVNIAFSKVKKGDMVNAVSVIDPEEIVRYNNITSITSGINGYVPGIFDANLRGYGSPLFIIDGLPRDIAFLSLQEVEQITVLKDINASMLYGNHAANGVVLITTKRGVPQKRQVNVTAYYGIQKPTILPDYLSSAEYMELYNEARLNDGLSKPYSDEEIENYRSGNKFRYPDVDYYSSEYLRKVKPFSRIAMDFSGGNDRATYFSDLEWEQAGSLINFGESESARSNLFKARGNVDLKISNRIKTSLDATALINNNKGAITNYWGQAAVLRPNLFSPLIPIDMIDVASSESLDDMVKGRKNDIDGKYLLGGSTAYITNPIADTYSAGSRNVISRNFSFNNRIDFDLGNWIEGLGLHTNISFDFYNTYMEYTQNTYSIYIPGWDAARDVVSSLQQEGTDTRSGVQRVLDANGQRRFGFYGMLDYNRTYGSVHHVSGLLLAYANKIKWQSEIQGIKNTNLGLKLSYNYDHKYMADFSSAVVSSVYLAESNRVGFSPSLGLAWVLSSEDFMSSTTFVDYLKIRLSGGIMNSDYGITAFYMYDDMYVTSGSYSWYEGSRSRNGVRPNWGGNSGLFYEKYKDINFGFEGLLFNRNLAVDANVFSRLYSDQLTQPQTQYPTYYYPYYIPYENYNEDLYRGVELGLKYTQSLGDFSFSLGANMMYATAKVNKRDEVHSEDYLYREGRPLDARFGLIADGFFSDQAEIDGSDYQTFGTVKPGDIKYIDQNADGLIDSNDQREIGRWQAPFTYGLNLRLSYKGFTLFATGLGKAGADGMLSGNYYWIDGDSKYSEVVRNRWTEATKTTATYPRLSSQSGDNNFINSTFWLYNSNYFTISNVQLTYEVPVNVLNRLPMKYLCFFVKGSNLFVISENKDIMELNVGSEPSYRSFSVGLRTSF